MIKKIHYCWFGGKPLNDMAQKCIQSWREMCPEYEIIEWNESNFDINCCSYVKEAYENKKWAFVSDYARFFILNQQGGLYFDTDVELIKPLDDIWGNGPFMGFESNSFANKSGVDIAVNPGLGLGGMPKMSLFNEVINKYSNRHFFREDGTFDQYTIVQFITDILLEKGLKQENQIQQIDGFTIYPTDYFAPLDYETGVLNKTTNTRSIHHYLASWQSKEEIRIHQLGQRVGRLLGAKMGYYSEAVIGLPYQIKVKQKQLGTKGTWKFVLKRIFGKKN